MENIEKSTTTSRFFEKFCKLIRVMGVGDFWVNKDTWPPLRYQIYYFIDVITNISLVILLVLEYAAVFAEGLNIQQKFDNAIFIWSHTIFLCYYISIKYNKDNIKKLVIKQCLTLPSLFVNEKIELSMMKYVKIYSAIFVASVSSTLLFYGVGGLTKALKGDPFVTLITIWPSIEDRSFLAETFRVYIYIIWYFMMIKILGFFLIVFSQATCLRHQFMHLHYYFMELEYIFKEDLSVELQELKFERKFKFGLRLHAETLWCFRSLQNYLGIAYSGQTALNLYCLALLMAQSLMSEKTAVNLMVFFMTVICVLLTAGAFMWNAGDITVEAATLPEAIFFSGWHHCRGAMKKKLCPLVVVAMQIGQTPVVLTAFNQLPMSYSTYVSIVKTSYSIFTLFY